MHYAELMEVGYATDDIFKEATSLVLFQLSLFDYVVKELALLYVFHDQE